MRASALALLLTLLAGPLAAAPLDAFVGAWRGVELIEGQDGAGLAHAPGELGMELERARGGFALDWTVFGSGPASARFYAADRPGVYYAADGNPLEGELLLWARVADGLLVVYSLILNDRGGFALDRYAYAVQDGGDLSLSFSRLRDGRPAGDLGGRLARAG